jgi:hypothetical protein
LFVSSLSSIFISIFAFIVLPLLCVDILNYTSGYWSQPRLAIRARHAFREV